eukprot:CAMPEP_0171327630 /NCGR_PEP_ID=MMETSP0878-20121228/147_1 /TAXON_ID=67004 /ORGANISM="Thalassiosira weissflogii, Strain CCMP1336" /LENGTH=230 /DNA_ID=CAMNT_0011827415 /DNA_START=20 /DNA_END=712 /DNA_ORIENTATION=+
MAISSSAPFPSHPTATTPPSLSLVATLTITILSIYPSKVQSATQHVQTTMCATNACTDTTTPLVSPFRLDGRKLLRGSNSHRYDNDRNGSIDDDDDDDDDDRTSTGSNDLGCKEYITPLDECYNAQILFPGDISWSHFDIYDSLEMRSLKRRFFESGDGTCRDIGGGEGDGTENNGGGESGGSGSGDEDSFVLPLDVCVGPFGPPRPWGKFTLHDKHDDDLGDEFDVIQT